MNRRGFTLIELILALAGCAVILAAIYGVFSRAVHLRDDATARTHDARVRSHALSVLRNDLLNARVTLQNPNNPSTPLASVLTGSATSHSGGFPGYLKFSTTTASDDQDLPSADIQQVEYYVTTDPNAQGQRSGLFVRTAQRDLLSTVAGTPTEEPLLAGVQSMEVSFYDGTDWQESWAYDPTDISTETPVPEAVRVRLQLAVADGAKPAAPIELLVPFSTHPPAL